MTGGSPSSSERQEGAGGSTSEGAAVSYQQLLRHPLVRELVLENERLLQAAHSNHGLNEQMRSQSLRLLHHSELSHRHSVQLGEASERAALTTAICHTLIERLQAVERMNRVLEDVNAELEGCMVRAQENLAVPQSSSTPRDSAVARRLSALHSENGRNTTVIISGKENIAAAGGGSSSISGNAVDGGGTDSIVLCHHVADEGDDSSILDCMTPQCIEASSRKRPRGGSISTTKLSDRGSTQLSPADIIKEHRTIVTRREELIIAKERAARVGRGPTPSKR